MKKIIKYIAINTAVILFVVHFPCMRLYPKIYKKINKDGSIEFYNINKGKNNSKRQNLSSRYDSLIEKIAGKERVDPFLIKCVIKVESNFYADAVSVAGAMGLMQLMQETARFYKINNPLDPEENLTAGIKHLKSLLKYFNNDIPLALAAYHAGLGRVKKEMSIPPIKSTIDYVNRVMFLYKGKKNFAGKVNKLYKRIEKDGTIVIYNK